MKPSLRITAVCVALTFAFPSAKAAGPVAKLPATIAEVHTWGGLLAQKPLTSGLPAAAKSGAVPPICRLGIDRTRSGLYGGAVLYCLLEGNITNTMSQDSLGPFAVEVVPPGSKPRQKQAAALKAGAQVDPPGAPMYFFMQVIPFDLPGEYVINLRKIPVDADISKSPILATAKVTVTKEQAPLWYPWELAEIESGSAAVNNNSDGPEQVSVAIPTEGIAQPVSAGPDPCLIKTPPNAKLPLPQLFPSTPDPGIHAGLQGNLLTVKFDKPTIASDPYDLIFLTRWWVNGRPYVPKLVLSEVPSRAIEWQSSWITAVVFRIDFQPKTLHVKKGDVIGVQLLFCPDGWKYTVPPNALEKGLQALAEADDGIPPAISRLTPRLNFTYTGNPSAIAPALRPPVTPADQ